MSEPTDDQLRAAWAELAQPDWGSFDQVRLAHLHWARVRMHALLRARGIPLDVRNAPPPSSPSTEPPVGGPPPSWGSLKVPTQEPLFDRKRAAAGEREDD